LFFHILPEIIFATGSAGASDFSFALGAYEFRASPVDVSFFSENAGELRIIIL
jgi:hypothetical protein